MKCAPLVALLLSLLTVCTANAAALSPTPATATSLNKIAEAHVKLVLALGQHDPDYVDAYYGPPEWKQQLQGKKPLDSLALEANRLRDQLAKISTPADEMERLRLAYLTNQLSAFEARVRILKGERLKFDEESQALYDAVAPRFLETHFQEILAKLESKLPGEGTLLQRYENWRRAFVISKDKLDTVFQLAIKACRERTLAHIKLPPAENFTVEYVTNKPWGGYNWYKGNYRSVIQVNTDLPIYIDRAIDLAAKIRAHGREAGETGDEVYREIPQLRHQLQSWRRHGAQLHRETWRHRTTAGTALARVSGVARVAAAAGRYTLTLIPPSFTAP